MVCDKLKYLLYLTSMCQNVDHTQSISCISTIVQYLLYLTSMCQNVDHTQSISCISTIVRLKMRFPFPFQELVSLNSVMVVYFWYTPDCLPDPWFSQESCKMNEVDNC